jgi:hypothetical protein
MSINTYPLRVSKKVAVLVSGGPYRMRPAHADFGVKLAREIDRPCEVSVPIQDFSVPETGDLNVGIYETVRAIRAGQHVYAGCMGGKGRTGLFLACLAKALGQDSPVEHVRKTYNSHAVETDEQYEFVTGYQPTLGIRAQVALLKATVWFKGHTGTVRRV